MKTSEYISIKLGRLNFTAERRLLMENMITWSQRLNVFRKKQSALNINFKIVGYIFLIFS